MNCKTAVDRMLEADHRELAREVESDLVSHLETCQRCQVLADQILSETIGLSRELEAQSSRFQADEALSVATEKATTRRRRNTLLQFGAPVAAAAGIAGMVLLADGNNGMENLLQARVPEALPGLEVQSPPGKDVAVFEVADRPDVVVVWFFDSGDE